MFLLPPRTVEWQKESILTEEFCIVKFKDDLDINCAGDVVYSKYAKNQPRSLEPYHYAELNFTQKHPNNKKYFFLPKKWLKDGREAEVSALFTSFLLKVELSKKVTVEEVESSEYGTVLEIEPDLFLIYVELGSDLRTDGFELLVPIIRIFSGNDQLRKKFYDTVAEVNKSSFVNFFDGDDLKDFVTVIREAAKLPGTEDKFEFKHLEAFSRAMLHVLSTSSYVYEEEIKPGSTCTTNPELRIDFLDQIVINRERRRRNVRYDCSERPWDIKRMARVGIEGSGHNTTYPAAFEDFQTQLFNLYLIRKMYWQYLNTIHDLTPGVPSIVPHSKAIYWCHSHYNWVMLEVLEKYIRQGLKKDRFTLYTTLNDVLLIAMLQPSFWILLKDKTMRQNFSTFLHKEYFPVLEKENGVLLQHQKEIIRQMFSDEYYSLSWDRIFWKEIHTKKLIFNFGEFYDGLSSYSDTANTIAQRLAIYHENREYRRQRKDIAEAFLAVLRQDDFFKRQDIEGIPNRDYLIGKFDEKHKAIYDEMKQILMMTIFDDRSDVPLKEIYDLYKDSQERINPSPGLLWLALTHRQAVEDLEITTWQQKRCFKMLETALNYLCLQTIEVFFSVIKEFIPRANDTLRESGTRREEQRIADYIEKRRKEEAEVIRLLHLGLEENHEINANIDKFQKNHRTSGGIFVFMYLFEYNGMIKQNNRIVDSYVLCFTMYLMSNPKVKEFFNKNKQLRHATKRYTESSLLSSSAKYPQLTDLLTLDWISYYNKWIVHKPVIGQYSIDTIKELRAVGIGAAGSAYLCIVPNFMDPVVCKAFVSGIEGDVTTELNALMKLQAHAHIVRIFGLVMRSLTPTGLLMEYCKGGSLESVIEKEGYMFEERTAFHWMAQAASGLKFLHDNNIIHLDVKPANMLLSKNQRFLKLSDMGLTKVGKEQTSFIVTGEKGTLGYQAWEIVDGKNYSYPADIFSLGRCLWSLFYKEHPFNNTVASSVIVPARSCKIFEGTEQETKYAEDLETAIEKTTDLDECDGTVYVKCPGHISRLIIRMTAVDSTLRPTADQMYEELKEMCNAITEKEKDSILRVTPQSKLWFSAPMKDEQTANVEIANVSETDNVQWVATCNDPDLKVNPNEGNLKPQDAVTVDVTCIKLKDTSMDNLLIKWHRLPHRSSHETDDQQEYIKKLKIGYNF